jgi:hypothetical protein
MDEKQSARIICEGGLDSSENYINLSLNKPGSATRLINYEVGLSGGYRRIDGYEPYDSDFAEVGEGVAEGKILGIIMFENTASGATEVIAARKTTGVDEYELYLYEFGTGWVAIATGLTLVADGVDKLRWDVGNDGENNILCIVDGINNAVLYDGTNWSQIDIADSGADFANAGGNQAIDAPTYVAFFQDTLFLATDTVNNQKGIVAHSAPNAYYDFLVANGAGQVIPGLEVVQLKAFRDNLYVFGFNAIKKIVVDSNTFVVRDVTANIGLLSSDAVMEIGGDIVFLAPDGFRPIAGTNKIGDVQLETLSKQIHQVVKDRIVGAVGTFVNTVVIRGKSQFRMFFGNDSRDAIDSRGIIGALRNPDQQGGWEFGELLGIRASCCASKYVSGEEVVLHGDYDGIVYKQESGDDFNGQNIVSVYSTPYLDLGDTEIRKVIEKVTAFIQGEGSLELVLGVTYDWGKTDIPSPSPYAIEVEALVATYDDPAFQYDDPSTTYGGILTPISVTNLEGSFFSVRLTFTTNNMDAPHSIHALIIEYANKGRR